MKKVYVIVAGAGDDAKEKANKVLELQDDVEIICVDSVQDIPIDERSLIYNNVMEVHKFIARPLFTDIQYEYIPKKRKGHERQYKYHK